MSEGQEFLKECKEVRDNFAAIAGLYTVDEHLVLRTEIDSLLIMYDQLCERVRLADSPNENSGLHKHFVNNRTCSTCLYCQANPSSEFKYDRHKCTLVKPFVSITDATKFVCDDWTEIPF